MSIHTHEHAAVRKRSRLTRRGAIAGAVALAIVSSAAVTPMAAIAATPPGITIADGKSAVAYSYETAIRERVFIPVAGVDQDLDGQTDVTAVDIIRPNDPTGALKSPAIIDPSPYYTTLGRGTEAQLLNNLGDGVTNLFPLYYDNYFVPRGYAMLHAQMNGTAFSTGCPNHGGPGDIESMKVVVDWLNGRVAAYDAEGNPVVADWHNGKSSMIGKSYDGTLANGVAATGVDGLSTIVPIESISDWYKYSRTNGIRHNTNYPQSLSNTVTNPDRRSLCAPVRDSWVPLIGEPSGDVTPFWDDRNYLLDVDNVKASVFAIQGLNDDNVRMSQFGEWWSALAENEVPRKVWLPKIGHVDPFDFRREVWVDTLHRWFDYWLLDIDNGIMTEPMATVETAPGEFTDESTWPAPGTEPVALNLTGTEAGVAGALALQPVSELETLSFTGVTGASISETNLVTDPTGQQATRLAFLSAPLETELRLSGTPIVNLAASINTTQANFGVALVDYGPATLTPRSPGDGSLKTDQLTCWGESNEFDSACFPESVLRSADVDLWRISRGALDSTNRDTLVEGLGTPVVAGQEYLYDFPMEPYDHTVPAGHRIGLLVTTNLSGYNNDGTRGVSVTVDVQESTIILPIVGGLAAAAASGGLGVPAPVELSFDMGGHGDPIEAQSVAYGATGTVPEDPTVEGYVFTGWFADAEFTTPFDFAAPLVTDAVAYAHWMTVEEYVASLEITASSLTVKKGGSVTVSVEGFGPDSESIGDVTELVTLTSSVATDVIDGDTITFPTASAHTITATLGEVRASVVIDVTVEAAQPPASEDAPPAGLAFTGATPLLAAGLIAALMALAGAALLIARRRAQAGAASE
ncbi:X-Pro dipeptidyl-peptidase [Microbacteriaceae bacterium SG_E_30_P1]|uniref:X-Pro dipeptidyl-peptidase n=1 Tax=Antiquaquibacter oligotrophicus TaxID=2880260 RepID=A0ABT6KNC2_9MICO|nr:CocE/NonD family hydrolase [Antiquaquibacter oligotrophicus]MDH6181498.1 X-Pro dipeptidyl-peptidase [Antiquaquibacter oligotrophicus]UDF12812.1 InlB B-repeat-containing protein [Antiquaquibacter oligotrophicus]